MAKERGKVTGAAVRKSERVGPNYPESHYTNPFNDGIDEYYHPNESGRTLEGLSANTIDHAGLPLHKKRYDSFWGPKEDQRGAK